jgi:hypothetical protein
MPQDITMCPVCCTHYERDLYHACDQPGEIQRLRGVMEGAIAALRNDRLPEIVAERLSHSLLPPRPPHHSEAARALERGGYGPGISHQVLKILDDQGFKVVPK